MGCACAWAGVLGREGGGDRVGIINQLFVPLSETATLANQWTAHKLGTCFLILLPSFRSTNSELSFLLLRVEWSGVEWSGVDEGGRERILPQHNQLLYVRPSERACQSGEGKEVPRRI